MRCEQRTMSAKAGHGSGSVSQDFCNPKLACFITMRSKLLAFTCAIGTQPEAEFLEAFTDNDLQPVVLNNRAGDLVLCVDSTYHIGGSGGSSSTLRVAACNALSCQCRQPARRHLFDGAGGLLTCVF